MIAVEAFTQTIAGQKKKGTKKTPSTKKKPIKKKGA
jgi:hypothetical protein